MSKIEAYLGGIAQEVEEFKQKLGAMSAEEIWDNSYSIYIYKEFGSYFADCAESDFEPEELDALINNKVTLFDLYDDLMGSDVSIGNYEDVHIFITEHLKYIEKHDA